MWGIILFIYLTDILYNINALLIIGTIILIAVTAALLFFFFTTITDSNSDQEKSDHQLVKRILNSKSLYILWAVCLLNLFIPQKQTMYLMTGLFVSNEVVTEISKSPLAQKAYKLAEQKLDEYLTELEKGDK